MSPDDDDGLISLEEMARIRPPQWCCTPGSEAGARTKSGTDARVHGP